MLYAGSKIPVESLPKAIPEGSERVKIENFGNKTAKLRSRSLFLVISVIPLKLLDTENYGKLWKMDGK